MPTLELAEQLQRHGVAHVPSALGEGHLGTLWSSIQPESAAGAVRRRSQETYGARGLLLARPQLRRIFAEVALDGLSHLLRTWQVCGTSGIATESRMANPWITFSNSC
jgi:hypothetical protein